MLSMKQISVISYIRPIGNILLLLAIIAEMIFFPSKDNLLGCGMTLICWILFVNLGLKKDIIHKHFFAWLMFLSMSLYRILPLYATLLEGKPISYGFYNSTDTFTGESFLYIISLFSFLLAVKRRHYNMKMHHLLNKIDYYDPVPDLALWILGLIGLFSLFFVLASRVQIGDVFGKFFATNSRFAVLIPFGTFVLLFILVYVVHPKRMAIISSKYIILSLLVLFFVFPFLSDISVAILAVRYYRAESGPIEMFKRTLDVYLDSDQMEKLYKEKEALSNRGGDEDYKEEWTENYVNNFALNRYCNIRVTDATLYYKNQIGNANPKMLGFFKETVLKLLPSPVLFGRWVSNFWIFLFSYSICIVLYLFFNIRLFQCFNKIRDKVFCVWAYIYFFFFWNV